MIGPGARPGQFVAYAVSWDGRLRQVDVATGQDAAAPELFLPPNGKPYGLNLYKNVVYTSTAQGCGGTPNQFYAFDLATKKVGSYNPGSGGMWPRLGPSIGRDGSVYAGSGDGDYYPEREVFGQSIVAVKQNPLTKALEMTRLVHAVERHLAAQARPRHERDRPGLRVEGQGIPGRGEQGVPHLAARHQLAGRRRPSHAGRSHAAGLQRDRALRRGRAVERALDLGGHRRHAAGC